MYIGKKSVRVAAVDGNYSVSEDGVVWRGGSPLVAINGVGVNLYGRRVKIAYLVAKAFVPNPECRDYVVHKNGDLRDNRAENLEWSNREEERVKRGRRPTVLWIRAWTPEGEVAGNWNTVREAAAETGVKDWQIRLCLAGKRKMAGGLLWGVL